MKLTVKGVPVTLTDNDFLSEGGEAKVYFKGTTAYKLYYDRDRMTPAAKIQELAVLLKKPNILCPTDIILDTNNKPVGFTSQYVSDIHHLPRFFSKRFREREGINHDTIAHLISLMRETIEFIHKNRILVVDLNEMNFLIGKRLKEVYFIDVDSYQTPSFPATAIAMSIKDRHAIRYDNLSDWFSFAVISFWMFIGIHPFKGTYPEISGNDAEQTLTERMERNISVLHRGVSIPRVCYPFAVIPATYLDWYKRVFEKGERLPPPNSYEKVATVMVDATPLHLTKLNVIDWLTLTHKVRDYYKCLDVEVVVTEKKVYVNRKEHPGIARDAVVGFTTQQRRPLAFHVENNKAYLYDIEKQFVYIQIGFSASTVMEYDNRLYALSDKDVIEIQYVESPSHIIPVGKSVCRVLPQAVMYDGLVIQNLIGRYNASIFPSSGRCVQVALPMLDGYQIIDAKIIKNVMMIVGVKKGKYDRFVCRFSKFFDSFDMRVTKDINYEGLNFTVIESGVCVFINEESDLEIFYVIKDDAKMTTISKSGIDGNTKLFKNGTSLMGAKGSKLYHLTLGKP